MDLIDREELLKRLKLREKAYGEKSYDGFHMIVTADVVANVPTIEAVPLDKLCEWLAEHSVEIPCESCSHFSNDHCTVIGDMDTPCPNKAKDWQKAIKGWMEGLDDHR